MTITANWTISPHGLWTMISVLLPVFHAVFLPLWHSDHINMFILPIFWALTNTLAYYCALLRLREHNLWNDLCNILWYFPRPCYVIVKGWSLCTKLLQWLWHHFLKITSTKNWHEKCLSLYISCISTLQTYMQENVQHLQNGIKLDFLTQGFQLGS